MSGFKFSLQRILELRASAEKLQAAIMQRAAAAEGARRLASQASAADLDRVQDQTSEIAAAPAGLWDAYALSAEAARSRQEQDVGALRDAEASRMAQQERFTDARQARRALELLREKRVAEWSIAAARAEQADTDEVARQVTETGDDE
ncbi:MAG: flagellar FliJ family protein [Gemmatimonadota bacterium]|nr:flagellar FliJ family protein [Gemmatimonadota bacterium]